ncbi:hypothetical protein ACLVWQ_28385 [Streptomyces sp. CWNU-52B]|uniref:hypothetical protein n=1 Tax=unclassified Streptomyces TaxID=2593676 RepID=UPI0039C44D7C
MNPVDDKEGTLHDGVLTDSTLSSAQETDGFAAIMKRLKGRSPQERAALKARADAAVLGYEAYALGHEYLERGDLDAARRWLQVAAGHHVPGAEQALAELAGQPALNDGAALTSVPAAVIVDAAARLTATRSCDPCSTDGSPSGKNDGLWAAAVENLHAARQAASARASAAQIIEQARRDAGELLAQAQQQAQAVVDDARAEAGRIISDAAHRKAVEEKRRQEDATGVIALARYQSDRPLYVTRMMGNLLTITSCDLTPSMPKVRRLEDLLADSFREPLHHALCTGFTTVQTPDLTDCYRDVWAVQSLAADAVRERLRTTPQTYSFRLALQVLSPAPGEAGRRATIDLGRLGIGCQVGSPGADSEADALLLWRALAHLLEGEEAFGRPDPPLRAAAARAAKMLRHYALTVQNEGSKAAAADAHAGVQEVVSAMLR